MQNIVNYNYNIKPPQISKLSKSKSTDFLIQSQKVLPSSPSSSVLTSHISDFHKKDKGLKLRDYLFQMEINKKNQDTKKKVVQPV